MTPIHTSYDADGSFVGVSERVSRVLPAGRDRDRETLQRRAVTRSAAAEGGETSDPYEGVKVPELRKLAAERGIEGVSSMKRAELVAALG